MKKTILASSSCRLALPLARASGKTGGSYISRAKAVSIAKTRGGRRQKWIMWILNAAATTARTTKSTLKTAKANTKCDVNAKTGKVISVHRDDDHDDDDHHHHDDHHHDGM